MEAVEVLPGVPLVVEVHLGDGQLHDRPHRLEERAHEPHQPDRAEIGFVRRPGVPFEECPVVALGEVMLHREVPEIEEDVAHPRVLPVEDPYAVAVVEEVGVEQIVVARTRR